MSSFLPAKLNLPIWKAATFHYRFQWLNDTGKATTPQDVTGFTAVCALKSLDGETTYMELTEANGGIVFNGSSGLIDIKISANVTSVLTWKQATYTLLVANPTTLETLPLLTGRFIVHNSL